jgi:hypothetical protein
VNAGMEHSYDSSLHILPAKKKKIYVSEFNNGSSVFVSKIQINNGSQIDKFSHGLKDKVNQRNCPNNRVIKNYEKLKLFLAYFEYSNDCKLLACTVLDLNII